MQSRANPYVAALAVDRVDIRDLHFAIGAQPEPGPEYGIV